MVLMVYIFFKVLLYSPPLIGGHYDTVLIRGEIPEIRTLELTLISKSSQNLPKKQYISTVKMIFLISNVRIIAIPD
jgi:hypothetical protein